MEKSKAIKRIKKHFRVKINYREDSSDTEGKVIAQSPASPKGKTIKGEKSRVIIWISTGRPEAVTESETGSANKSQSSGSGNKHSNSSNKKKGGKEPDTIDW